MPVDNAERWGGRFAHAQSRLYLIIHDICGTALSDPVTQHCLATLASCASVSIVATLGNLNSMVHWDSRVLAQFAWSYHHIATFDRYNIPAGAEFPLVVPNNAVLAIQEFNPAAEENEDEDDLEAEGVDTSAPLTGGSRRLAPPQAQPSAGKAAVITTAAMAATARAFHSMEAIRSSLTNKHAQLLAAMVELLRKRSRQMEEEAAAALEATSSGMMRSKRIAAQPTRALNAHQLSHHYGVPIDELYGKLRSTLNVKSRNDVLSLLKEYYDHGVIAKIVHQNVEYLCLKPPYSLKNVDAKGALIL